MKRKKRSYHNLIIFFSVLITGVLIFFLFLTKISHLIESKNRQKIVLPTQASILSHDLQIIHTASVSGTVICSTEDPNKCDEYPQNSVLEYHVGCNGPEASSSIYICKSQGSSGKWWTYVSWTTHGSCHFCTR